jgi:hypothetical protein
LLAQLENAVYLRDKLPGTGITRHAFQSVFSSPELSLQRGEGLAQAVLAIVQPLVARLQCCADRDDASTLARHLPALYGALELYEVPPLAGAAVAAGLVIGLERGGERVGGGAPEVGLAPAQDSAGDAQQATVV